MLEENIVKHACRELGITQKELAENTTMRIEVAKKLILKSSVHESDIEYADCLIDNLEKITSEKDVRDFLTECLSGKSIVKRTCKELGITQKELAELMGVNDGTPAQWSSKGEIPETAKKFMATLVENKNLKIKLNKFRSAFNLIDEARV
ncbi:MAG: hypothetical protein Q7T77_04930 [Sulfuricurvum sp.]|nr:hypothetical protein [Sulfuricurvum sp.]